MFRREDNLHSKYGSTIKPTVPTYISVDADADRNIENNQNNQDRHKEHYRYPTPLSSASLSVFLAVFVAALAGLAALRYIAGRSRGLPLLTTNHYAWTYGPTAIFVIMTSFWRLVDYHCKALTPWYELQKSNVKPDRSVWLDHVSAFLVMTLFRAAKFSQLAVVLSILGFLLLKLVTLASTGLFLPSIEIIGPFDVQMKRISAFDNVTALRTFASSYVVDPQPLYMLYATHDRGLPVPEGVSKSMNFEALRPVINQPSENATYVAQSRAFVPRVNCEPIQIDPLVDETYGVDPNIIGRQGWQILIHDTTRWRCPSNATGNWLMTMNAATQVCPPRQLYPIFYDINCTSLVDEKSSMLIVMAIADLRYTQSFDPPLTNQSIGDDVEAKDWSFEIPTVQGVLCEVSHVVEPVTVSYNFSSSSRLVSSVERTPGSTNSSLTSINPDAFTTAIMQTAAAGYALFGSTVTYQYAEQPPQAVPRMIASEAGGDYEYLVTHPSQIPSATEGILTALGVQIARYIMGYTIVEDDAEPEVTGQVLFRGEKLQVQQVSFTLMVVGLTALVLVTFGLYFLRPKVVSASNLGTSISIASILRESNEVHKSLQQTAVTTEKHAKDLSKYHTFSLHIGEASRICLEQSATGNRNLHQNQIAVWELPKKRAFYNPLTLTKPFMITTLLLALVVIGILEYLQHLSDTSSNGLYLFPNSATTEISLFTRYIPAIVSFLVATMFNCFDFNTALLSRFSKMHGTDGYRQDLLRPLQALLPPVALFTSFRRHYWAACFTGSAAIVGSILTVVSSGLYTITYQPDAVSTTITIESGWNLSFSEGLSSDNATGAVVSLLEGVNLSYPLFTYDGLAFPTFSSTSGQVQSPGSIEMRVPALRAELACIELESRYVSLSTYLTSVARDVTTNMGARISVPLPDNCLRGSRFGNESFINAGSMSAALKDGLNASYVAQYLDLHVGPWQGLFYESGANSPSQPDNPPGCPSVLLSYGYFNGNDSKSSTVTALRCDQKIQSLFVNVTLRVPDMSISLDRPPIPDESSVKYLNSGLNETAFWWRLQAAIDESLQFFNKSMLDPYIVEYDRGSMLLDVSNFFRGVLFGRTPLPLSKLKENDQATKDQIFDHVQKFYRRYMAQYISANMRIPLDAASQEPNNKLNADALSSAQSVPATFTADAGIPRLVQNRTSATILQAMLAYMFVSCSLAWCFGKYHDLVMWNPCTIMGQMHLFAGSKLCQPSSSANNGEQRGRHAEAQSLISRSISNESRGNNHTYEMEELAPSQTTLSAHHAADTDVESRHALIGEYGEHTTGATIDSQHNLASARFRLGWWRHGEFRGRRGPEGETAEDGWRYGIDFIG